MWRSELWKNTAVLLLHLPQFSFCFHVLSLKVKGKPFSLWIRYLANLYPIDGIPIISTHRSIRFILTFKTTKSAITSFFVAVRINFYSIPKCFTSMRKAVFFQNGIRTSAFHSAPLPFFTINYTFNVNRWWFVCGWIFIRYLRNIVRTNIILFV